MPNYSQLIDRIVATRNSVAGGFNQKIAIVEKWEKYVETILRFYVEKRYMWNIVLADSKCGDQAVEIEEKLKLLLSDIHKLLGENEDGKSLRAASSRANRSYVNLGIVGPWRIGKSQIIQKLTGLDTWLIPTGNARNCTACPINVINDTYQGEAQVAVLSLYSVPQMCATINEYIERCGMKGVISELTATSQNDFLEQCRMRVSQIPQQAPSNADAKGLFDKMKKYIENASEYYRNLSGESKVIRNIHDISSKQEYRPLVSYYATPGAAQETFQCLATQKADLYVNFHFLDDDNVGKLRILDTPGIGESKLNVAEVLSHALRYDLDIAIAAAQGRPSIDDDKQIRDFHRILKEETNGRNPENWIYYLYNVYSTTPGMTSSVLKEKHKLVEDDLKDSIVGASGIHLPASHFKDIDCLINQGIVCPDEDNIPLSECRKETETLGTFFDSILSEMVGAILQVDNVFYEAADNYFSKVKSELYQILSLIRTLPIINYNNQTIARIDKQMSDLSLAIGRINSSLHLYNEYEENDPNHSKTLWQKIQEYCAESDYGQALMSILNKKGSAHDFDSLFNVIKEQLGIRITDSNWRENYDFDAYIQLKRELIKKIENDVLSKYDKDMAERNLAIEKKKILDAYKEVGKLAAIAQDSSDNWCMAFIQLLEERGQYPDLLKIFKEFVAYDLNIETRFRKIIESLKSKNQHRDQFIYDEDDYMPFDDYDKALKAFAYSLYQIEIGIKTALSGSGESSYEAFVKEEEGSFLSAISPIKNIPFASATGYLTPAIQLQMLYQEYSEVFNDDETATKNGVAEEWKRICKFDIN